MSAVTIEIRCGKMQAYIVFLIDYLNTVDAICACGASVYATRPGQFSSAENYRVVHQHPAIKYATISVLGIVNNPLFSWLGDF